ncbi:PPR repeat [Musa troglodytarum]|uniref:PPR repeat n=1 Tax=Musa troglodytarum TaxID=320322 RepID=A0A9E7KCG5_9LILI|nr:PPR repeat [Musa troglodytarum]
MKASGVIPDTFALNLVIKACSKCLEMEEAIRVFKEIGLYGCEPNEFSYGYIVQGLCRKGWVGKSMDCFKEMRAKGLALERRLGEGIEVVFDMLRNGMTPDLLTYRTVLEEMCREGRADAAFELLEELGRAKGAMDRRTYSDLLEGLHWLCQPRE